MPQFNEQKSPLSQFKMGQNQVSWRHQQVEISGHGLKTIHFMDTTPNLFMIQNPTSATLYIGITNIPTENSYEWKVSPNSSKTFGRPIATDELYILNKTNVYCTVNLFSVYDRFDLSLLADMTVSLDQSIAEEIKGDGIVKGFGAGVSLPSGTKHIGEVSLSGAIPAGTNHIGKVTLSGGLPAGTNHLGEVSISDGVSVSAELDDATKTNIAGTKDSADQIKNYTSQLVNNTNDVKGIKGIVYGCSTNLSDLMLCMNNTYSGTNILALILDKLGEIKTATGTVVNETIGDVIFYQKENVTESQSLVFTETVIDGVTKSPTERFYANRMILFSNDGEKDIAIKLYRNSTDYTEIVLKAGESISNLNVKNPVVTIEAKTTGDTISYRVMYGIA